MFRIVCERLWVVAAFSEGRGEGCVWRASKDLIFFSGPVRRWPLPHLKRHFHTDSWTWRGKSTQGWAWRVFPSFSSTCSCVLERCVSATVNSIERVYRLFHRSSPQPSLQTLPQTIPQTIPQAIPQVKSTAKSTDTSTDSSTGDSTDSSTGSSTDSSTDDSTDSSTDSSTDQVHRQNPRMTLQHLLFWFFWFF